MNNELFNKAYNSYIDLILGFNYGRYHLCYDTLYYSVLYLKNSLTDEKVAEYLITSLNPKSNYTT